jgi:molybdenum cofactor biosynthesis protein MoaC
LCNNENHYRKRRNDERMIFLYYGLFVFSFEGYGVVLSFHCLLSSLALASLGLRNLPSRYVEHAADCCAGDRKHVKTSYNPKPTQYRPGASRSPWSQIPTHLLSTPHSASFGQVRAYSSDSKDAAGLEFGFQSLGSLFPAPPAPGRYSRPKERRAEEAASKESEAQAPAEDVQKVSAEKKPNFQPTSPAKPTESNLKAENATQTKSQGGNVSSERTLIRRVHEPEGSVSVGRRRERLPAKRPQASVKPRTITPARGERKVPNPFATRTKKVAPSDEAETDTRPNAKAWGLSQEDQDTIDSISNPAVPLIKSSDNQEAPKSADNVPETPSSPRLTHVNSSGEAHMVDVGDKASTKRVAIAVAHVSITREVYDQIVDNSNKKGDVLGIARIAGIMAAKRTSDIIPLCHPLAISKAEVDVNLVPAVKLKTGQNHYWRHTSPTGLVVAIQARVECFGPTGVEMEALMAVQGAALTVYDMCKAVDKTMTIHAAKVVYKAGGRSGIAANKKWKQHVGVEKFAETGELKDGVDAVVRLPPDVTVL